MDTKDKIIEHLQQLVAKLTAEIADLKLAMAKARKDSSTLSKPPSSDITRLKTAKKPGRRGKPKRGGQAGYERHLRVYLTTDGAEMFRTLAISSINPCSGRDCWR